MAGKTNKKQSKRSPALTEANKRRQAKAREKRALKRIGIAAAKRTSIRAYLSEKRKENPTFGKKNPPGDGRVEHRAFNQDSRGVSQLIYSCTFRPDAD